MTAELKRSALLVMRAAGLFDWSRERRWRRERLAILCYHSLARHDEHEWAPALFISPAHFERRLQWLAEKRYNVIPLSEGLELMSRDELPPRSVAITFDDGTADFADLAWPLLERYSMPATVYWTTYYSTISQPVFGMMCDYLLWRARQRMAPAQLWGGQGQRDLAEYSRRAAVLEEIASFVRREGMTLAQRHAWAAQLAGALEIDYSQVLARRSLQLMTPDEARAVASRGADLQLHTHRHRTPVDEVLFRREIEDNRSRIEAVCGKPPEHFCYPSGKMAAEFFPWLAQAGVRSAVTCESGLAAPGSHPYLLPRIVDTSTLGELEFEAWLSGARLLLGGSRRAGDVVGVDPLV